MNTDNQEMATGTEFEADVSLISSAPDKSGQNQPMAIEKIGIIGLGYVGLPLLMAVAENNGVGLGFDVKQERVDALNEGRSYLKTIKDGDVKAHLNTGRFSATTDMARLAECDAVLICVPTPLNAHREPDLKYVISSTEEIAKYLRKGQLVVLESTTYPGTTDQLMLPILEKTGLKCGKDFYLAYSPEREDPGNISFSTSTIPKVIGGIDQASLEQATLLYQRFIHQVVTVSSTRTAEAVKLTENIFRAINIGLVNELKTIFDEMDIDTWEVIDAAKTKPFGFMAFYPGPGWGGHCIPVDPFYLTWKAREFGLTSRFIEHAGEINELMPQYVVHRTAIALDETAGRGLRDTNILLLGVAYKSDVDDARESPAIKIIKGLQDRKAHVSYHDPYIPEFSEEGIEQMVSQPIDGDNLEKYDAVIICADHKQIDWEHLVSKSKIVVDTRNATHHVVNHRERIYKA